LLLNQSLCLVCEALFKSQQLFEAPPHLTHGKIPLPSFRVLIEQRRLSRSGGRQSQPQLTAPVSNPVEEVA
jgi:hypothetical protein